MDSSAIEAKERAFTEAVHSEMFLKSRMASQFAGLSRNDRKILKEARQKVNSTYQDLQDALKDEDARK